MLGDSISTALKSLGITEDRVSRWLGHPCNCDERRQKLNQLQSWAARVLRGKTDSAREFLRDIISGE